MYFYVFDQFIIYLQKTTSYLTSAKNSKLIFMYYLTLKELGIDIMPYFPPYWEEIKEEKPDNI